MAQVRGLPHDMDTRRGNGRTVRRWGRALFPSSRRFAWMLRICLLTGSQRPAPLAPTPLRIPGTQPSPPTAAAQTLGFPRALLYYAAPAPASSLLPRRCWIVDPTALTNQARGPNSFSIQNPLLRATRPIQFVNERRPTEPGAPTPGPSVHFTPSRVLCLAAHHCQTCGNRDRRWPSPRRQLGQKARPNFAWTGYEAAK